MASAGDVSMEGLIEWGEGAVPLKHFVDKYGVPNIGKVVKGQYRDVGVAKSVHSELFIHSVQISQKVLAEGVKVKEGKKVVVAGNQKYSLPLTYQGWFELLSQDGKAVKAISSVADLARAFPPSVLIRESFKVFVPRESGEVSLDKVRVLPAGEQVNLVGEVWVTVSTPKGMVKRCLLHCMDLQGENIYMPIEQKGLFSPIAGQTNISGVHTLRGLLDKFRMPILVRLVHGVIPSKLEKNFTGVFKLNSLYSEESAFVCPMKKDAKMVPISTREPLKLVAASNYDSLKDNEECKYHLERCSKMIASYLNSIHLLFSLPEPDSLIPRVKEENMKQDKNKSEQSPDVVEENILFEEVEDIYAYVREGGPVPPPPRPRPATNQGLPAPGKGKKPLKPKSSFTREKIETPLSKQKESNAKKSLKSVSPIPVSTPSPVPSPTPPADFLPTKDDYWEEPIYEPLDKIKQMKKNKKVEETIPAPVVLPTSPARHSPEPQMVTRNKSSSGNNSPVQNLRQMYKLTHEPLPTNYSIPRPSLKKSDDDIDELKEILDDMEPPPVPPKKYHETKATLDTGSSEHVKIDQSDVVDGTRSPPSTSREKLQQESEETIAFESESVISDKEASHQTQTLFNSKPATSPTVVNSTIPISPGGPPVVTVHTPMVARAKVTNSYPNKPVNGHGVVNSNSRNMTKSQIISNSQPTVAVNNPMPSKSVAQSQEILSQPSTYVYTTVPPANYSKQNGYSLARQNSHKVLLNKPKDPHEKQVLNTNIPVTAVKVSPTKSHIVYSRTGSSSNLQNNRTSLSPMQQAPFVAVARVGDSGSGVDMYDSRAPVIKTDSRRKMMHSMYL